MSCPEARVMFQSLHVILGGKITLEVKNIEKYYEKCSLWLKLNDQNRKYSAAVGNFE